MLYVNECCIAAFSHIMCVVRLDDS